MINVFGISFLAGIFATIVAAFTGNIPSIPSIHIYGSVFILQDTFILLYFSVYGFAFVWVYGHYILKRINHEIESGYANS